MPGIIIHRSDLALGLCIGNTIHTLSLYTGLQFHMLRNKVLLWAGRYIRIFIKFKKNIIEKKS